MGWLAACHNGFNNSGSEEAERQQLAHIARGDLFASGQARTEGTRPASRSCDHLRLGDRFQ